MLWEIYSLSGVAAEIRRSQDRYFVPGFAVHITTVDPVDGKPWGFSRKSIRDKARKMLRT